MNKARKLKLQPLPVSCQFQCTVNILFEAADFELQARKKQVREALQVCNFNCNAYPLVPLSFLSHSPLTMPSHSPHSPACPTLLEPLLVVCFICSINFTLAYTIIIEQSFYDHLFFIYFLFFISLLLSLRPICISPVVGLPIPSRSLPSSLACLSSSHNIIIYANHLV